MVIDYDFMTNSFAVLWVVIGLHAVVRQWEINLDKRLKDMGLDPENFE